ncbi:MAG: serine/threonine protein phosphatase [Novosphingobium sp.]|jgi:serine/threonine protein phosphatase 1|nr:serine/threonine protein phosphatase [Novosphingobium sp.]
MMLMQSGEGGFAPDRIVYAVGDIHGRADLLERLLGRIRKDRDQREPGAGDAPPLLVFLGDYVDRGAESRRAIDLLLELAGDPGFECRFLAGNHEDAMLDFLDGKIVGQRWAEHGGDATLRAYGVTVPYAAAPPEAWAQAQARFMDAVPAEHIAFLRGLELMVTVGKLAFVHAGIRPGIPLADQTRRDLLWIRSQFLDVPHSGDGLIVHGHTPGEEVYGAPGRLCLDTGAYMSGRLSAAVFAGETIDLIDTFSLGARPLERAMFSRAD